MKKILLLLGAILFSHNLVEVRADEDVSENTGATESTNGEEQQAEENEEESASDDSGYDMTVAGWGRNDRELLNDYGVILNYVDGFLQEMIDNDALSVFYVFDSSQFSDSSSMTAQMHRMVLTPGFKELKGFAKFYAFDC